MQIRSELQTPHTIAKTSRCITDQSSHMICGRAHIVYSRASAPHPPPPTPPRTQTQFKCLVVVVVV